MALAALGVKVDHVFSCDNDKKEQICANYPNVRFYEDLMERDNATAPASDLYIAGFPCQPFSAAGKGSEGLNDVRGTVFFGCADYIKAKKPRAYILENVKAILSNDKGKTWKTIMRVLKGMHRGAYHVEHKVLDTQQHGVPQSRQRVYIVGVLKTAMPHGSEGFPWPEALPLISIEPLLDPIQRKPTLQDLPPQDGPATPYKGAKEVLEALQKAKQHPFKRTYLIDIDASPKYRTYMADRVMCMTKSRPCGHWISSRARRMNIDEMLRLQGRLWPGMDRKFLGKQAVSDKVLGAMIGNAMSQNVLERLFINLLPFAGLVPKGAVLEDRWLARTQDPKWPRSQSDVKKIALPKETPKRKMGKAGRVPAGKKVWAQQQGMLVRLSMSAPVLLKLMLLILGIMSSPWDCVCEFIRSQSANLQSIMEGLSNQHTISDLDTSDTLTLNSGMSPLHLFMFLLLAVWGFLYVNGRQTEQTTKAMGGAPPGAGGTGSGGSSSSSSGASGSGSSSSSSGAGAGHCDSELF
eukprot:Skav200819  [mRNA]  locus=scaffold454:109604:119547:- [translate_table: standard]